jgi:hypothetical protein
MLIKSCRKEQGNNQTEEQYTIKHQQHTYQKTGEQRQQDKERVIQRITSPSSSKESGEFKALLLVQKRDLGAPEE